jgi:hypothetical protein
MTNRFQQKFIENYKMGATMAIQLKAWMMDL